MARLDPYSVRLKQQKSAADADQSEIAAVRLGTTIIGAGAYDDRVASSLDDHSANGAESQAWAQDDLTADSAVGAIQDELARRRSLLGDAYPFSVSSGTLTYTASASLIYEFFLAAATSTDLTSGQHARLPRVFERIVTQLLAVWLGDARGIHTGFPRDKDVGSTFKAAMETVCASFIEPCFLPQNHLPDHPIPGDHGVDCIICKPSPDGRPIGQLFLLAQCACGNDWTSKFSDLSLQRWSTWFHPFSLVPPIRAFATPHHVVDGWLYVASSQAGLVFDRSRLVKVAALQAATPVIAEFRAELATLVDLVVSGRR